MFVSARSAAEWGIQLENDKNDGTNRESDRMFRKSLVFMVLFVASLTGCGDGGAGSAGSGGNAHNKGCPYGDKICQPGQICMVGTCPSAQSFFCSSNSEPSAFSPACGMDAGAGGSVGGPTGCGLFRAECKEGKSCVFGTREVGLLVSCACTNGSLMGCTDACAAGAAGAGGDGGAGGSDGMCRLKGTTCANGATCPFGNRNALMYCSCHNGSLDNCTTDAAPSGDGGTPATCTFQSLACAAGTSCVAGLGPDNAYLECACGADGTFTHGSCSNACM
jgi:hypothetical protein